MTIFGDGLPEVIHPRPVEIDGYLLRPVSIASLTDEHALGAVRKAARLGMLPRGLRRGRETYLRVLADESTRELL